MAANFESGKTVCLLNEHAQCNPIWVSQPGGVQLAHFPTFRPELPREGQTPVDAADYAKCARFCVPADPL